MGIFRRSRQEQRSQISIADPALADFFGLSPNLTGVRVSESTALTVSAVYRAVALIGGTVAALPLKSFRTTQGDVRERVRSFLDNPAGPESVTPYEWKETVMAHLLLHGNAFLLHVYNGAGSLVGLDPIHPYQVSVAREPGVPGGKVFRVTLDDSGRTIDLTAVDLTHIPGLSTDGLRGYSVIHIARNSFGTAIAGDRSAARMFGNGALVSGLVTPEDDLTEEDAKAIKESLRAKMLGTDNAGDIAVINRKLKFERWSLSNEDAQFIQSREFQVIEVARWFGLPPHLLGETQRQTSWGSGVQEQNHGLARFTLQPWTERIQERLSTLLPNPRFVEFDYAGLLKPTPGEEIDLLIRQVREGFLTLNEARRIQNLPPLEGGDRLRLPPGSLPDDPNEEGATPAPEVDDE